MNEEKRLHGGGISARGRRKEKTEAVEIVRDQKNRHDDSSPKARVQLRAVYYKKR